MFCIIVYGVSLWGAKSNKLSFFKLVLLGVDLQFDYPLIFHMTLLQCKCKLKYLWGIFVLSGLAASNVVHPTQAIQNSFSLVLLSITFLIFFRLQSELFTFPFAMERVFLGHTQDCFEQCWIIQLLRSRNKNKKKYFKSYTSVRLYKKTLGNCEALWQWVKQKTIAVCV